MQSCPRRYSLLFALGVWISSASAQAADFHCTGGDVQCLKDAINTSNFNQQSNTIRLDASTYSFTEADNSGSIGSATFLTGNALPVVIGDVTIVGVSAEETILERANFASLPDSNLFRIFNVATTGRLVLDRVTVRGGNPGRVATAGGIFSQGTLEMRESRLTNNSSAYYMGIQVANGTLTMTDTLVANNTNTGLGGGVVVIGGRVGFPQNLPFTASGTIRRSTFSNNVTGETPTLDVDPGATAEISDTTVVDNGGGVFGGGIGAVAGTATIRNTTVARNLGPTFESGIYAGENATIINSTVVGNSTNINGAGLVRNSIVGGFTGGNGSNCSHGTRSLGHNLFGESVGCTLELSDRLDPGGLAAFVDAGRPGAGFFPLRADSAAIDAADADACSTTDQNGLVRSIDGNGDGVRACDIGAVEFYPVVNDLVRLDRITGRYVPPSEGGAPLAEGGEFRITPTFAGNDQRDICHVVFEVVALAGIQATPVLLTADDRLIGSQGAVVRSDTLGAPVNLPANATQAYYFRIGVDVPEAITFMVNVLGEATAGACQQ